MGPGRAADHLPLSSVAVTEEYSYTSTPSLGHTGPVTGSLYSYLLNTITLTFKGREVSVLFKDSVRTAQ